MQTAEFDHTSFEQRQQSQEDKKLLVKFYLNTRPDAGETAKQGRPIFKEVEYIDIRIPGDRAGGVARPASHADKNRFPEHYAAFKNRTEIPLEGTPLIEWPLITRSHAEELAFFNVKTVEHLATMSDTHSGKFMGLNALKTKAKAWLEQSDEEAKAHKLQDELLERDERIAAQDEQIKTLQEQMSKLLQQQEPDWPAAPAAPAPSLTSELDEPVAEVAAVEPEPEADVAKPATKKRARRRRKGADSGAVQDSE